MYEIEKTFRFEAGHVLKHHDGRCKDPHGHSYVLTIHIQSETLITTGPKKNMVIDFSDISSLVKPMIDTYFEHKWLNDTLNTDSPTVEFMAQWIYEFLEPSLPGLFAVSLYETVTSRVIYKKTRP
jgi:6-pyruvoyltetrahydropterin/6-carboxytetrahydropterin synthase